MEKGCEGAIRITTRACLQVETGEFAVDMAAGKILKEPHEQALAFTKRFC